MALQKERLWSIVSGEEAAPEDVTTNVYAKFKRRSELTHLLGEPDDPVAVWKKLPEQFQKKTWANKLAPRYRLYCLQLNTYRTIVTNT